MLARVVLLLLVLVPGAALAQGAHTQGGIRPAQSAQTGYSPERLLEHGRAEAEAGRVGEAIVSFERGLLLAPRSSELHEALSRARSAAGLPSRSPTGLDRVVLFLAPHEWALFGFASAFVLALAVLGIATLRRKAPAATLAALSALSLASAWGAYQARADQLATAFARGPTVPAQLSPFASAEESFRLSAGQAVMPDRKHGAYVHITDERGRVGWVRKADLIPLVPRASVGS
jgi:hypothetical protein